MADQALVVQWTGRRALVTLPRHIDSSNAGQICEQLLWIINRGAVVLIADLTGTASCDYSGADALARAHHRAVVNGAVLRLVVTADVVRRVLSINGLDRRVPVYPDLDAALAAGAEPRELHGEQAAPAAHDAAGGEELLGLTVERIFNVGLILQAALDLPPDITARRITEALHRLDEAVQQIRDHVFATRSRSAGPGPDRTPSRQLLERSAQAMEHSALLHRHVAHTARAVQSAATDTAALLERRAEVVGHPGRIDYPTDIKRWRAVADQAAQMAERWEQ